MKLFNRDLYTKLETAHVRINELESKLQSLDEKLNLTRRQLELQLNTLATYQHSPSDVFSEAVITTLHELYPERVGTYEEYLSEPNDWLNRVCTGCSLGPRKMEDLVKFYHKPKDEQLQEAGVAESYVRQEANVIRGNVSAAEDES